MSKGYFWVSRDGNSQDIHFKQIELKEGDAVPEEQLELRDKVDSVLTTIRTLFGDRPERFELYFRPLLSLAQLGLVGDSANPMLAKRVLISLQNDILTREGGAIKNGYMKSLGAWSLLLGVPVLLLG